MSTAKQRLNKIEKQLQGEASVYYLFQADGESDESFRKRVDTFKKSIGNNDLLVSILNFSDTTKEVSN